MENYKDYELHYYPKSGHSAWDNRYQTFKARPYDDAEYYWAYTYDKKHWRIVYDRKCVEENFIGTFEEVVDFIEERNKDIKCRISHW